ncbi:hypothetical protein K461DRAFT_117429 [Myriangium duriaei CBS 260.36]|uniref:EKC/KEOPS complex subunit CGI121 n=1 Tax=Myriangium duriaei CBS 260.36 TaxID=1168546 RepID=A0A9P4J3J2_9PEZI|nr:hypothetical protein K461DRAFT_117429 [Myriangium duriaei CBS 260.36]
MSTSLANVLETITLPHLEQYTIYVVLFRDVRNPECLTPTGDQFDYAFLDASMLSSRRQLLDACFVTVHDLAAERLSPWLVHSRIISAVSCFDSAQYPAASFGISPTTRDIVAVKVAMSQDVVDKTIVAEDLLRLIHGLPEPLTDSNLAQLRGHELISETNEHVVPANPLSRPSVVSAASLSTHPESGHDQLNVTNMWAADPANSPALHDQDWVLYEHDGTPTSMSLWTSGQNSPASLFNDSGYEGSSPDINDLAWHLTHHLAAASLEEPASE